MIKKRCPACVGSGKVMGGGMMMTECDECDGRGKIYEKSEPVIDKDSKEYKNAITNIKKLGDNISDEQADQMFEDAWKAAK
jgi:DnaJ-class molecular chaperone